MKRIIFLILTLTCTIFLMAGCGSVEPEKVGEVGGVSAESQRSDSGEETFETVQEDLKKIEITHELQDIHEHKQKVVIWVSNDSDKILSGNLRIDIKSRDDHILAIDNFPIDDLKPGQKKYAVMMAETTYPVNKVTYSWSNVEFMEPALKEAEKRIDEEATKEVTDVMNMNFGGAGNPEYKTSWYDYIDKIEVYTDGENKWAEVTLSVSEQDKCNQIARAILYSVDYLIRVKALDGSGNQILEVYK